MASVGAVADTNAAHSEIMSRTCLVVPCFNEAKRLDCDAIDQALSAFPSLSLVLVDDGSTDSTWRVIDGLARAHGTRVQAIKLSVNQGKAEAVRRGLLEAALPSEAEYVGFWDADFATPLSAFPNLVRPFEEHPGLLMVFGSRVKMLGSEIERSVVRHIIGRAFATLAAVVVDLGVYDTQCGAKLFRNTPELKELFAQPFISPWLFDVEILARIARSVAWDSEALRRSAKEIPVGVWRDVKGSKVRPSHFPRLIADLSRIALHYRLGR